MSREQEILVALATATGDQREALSAELARVRQVQAHKAVRAAPVATVAFGGGIDYRNQVTAASDWLLRDEPRVDDGRLHREASAAAHQWWSSVSDLVKSHTGELGTQARGAAAAFGVRFGAQAPVAISSFMQRVAHLSGGKVAATPSTVHPEDTDEAVPDYDDYFEEDRRARVRYEKGGAKKDDDLIDWDKEKRKRNPQDGDLVDWSKQEEKLRSERKRKKESATVTPGGPDSEKSWRNGWINVKGRGWEYNPEVAQLYVDMMAADREVFREIHEGAKGEDWQNQQSDKSKRHEYVGSSERCRMCGFTKNHVLHTGARTAADTDSHACMFCGKDVGDQFAPGWGTIQMCDQCAEAQETERGAQNEAHWKRWYEMADPEVRAGYAEHFNNYQGDWWKAGSRIMASRRTAGVVEIFDESEGYSIKYQVDFLNAGKDPIEAIEEAVEANPMFCSVGGWAEVNDTRYNWTRIDGGGGKPEIKVGLESFASRTASDGDFGEIDFWDPPEVNTGMGYCPYCGSRNVGSMQTPMGTEIYCENCGEQWWPSDMDEDTGQYVIGARRTAADDDYPDVQVADFANTTQPFNQGEWTVDGPPVLADHAAAASPGLETFPGFYRNNPLEWVPERSKSRMQSEKERLFPDGIPLRGELTPEQEAWLKRRSSITSRRHTAATIDELRAAHGDLFAGANDAYNRNDQAWFDALPLGDLEILWDSVSGYNMGVSMGAWDDEVYEALADRGYDFDSHVTGSRRTQAQMFPGAGATVYRNDAGEVMGWSDESYFEPEYDDYGRDENYEEDDEDYDEDEEDEGGYMSDAGERAAERSQMGYEGSMRSSGLGGRTARRHQGASITDSQHVWTLNPDDEDWIGNFTDDALNEAHGFWSSDAGRGAQPYIPGYSDSMITMLDAERARRTGARRQRKGARRTGSRRTAAPRLNWGSLYGGWSARSEDDRWGFFIKPTGDGTWAIDFYEGENDEPSATWTGYNDDDSARRDAEETAVNYSRTSSRRTAEEGQTCSSCGGSIERDPAGEANRSWHHNDGDSHDHEAKPGGKESRRVMAARPIYEIAAEIKKVWGFSNINFAARPYLDAMMYLNTIKDNYGADSGAAMVAYFLSNASSFRGPDAKRLKDELRAIQKGGSLHPPQGKAAGRGSRLAGTPGVPDYYDTGSNLPVEITPGEATEDFGMGWINDDENDEWAVDNRSLAKQWDDEDHAFHGTASRRTALDLSNVSFEGGIGSSVGVGTDSQGNRVRFRLSAEDSKSLASVMTSDLGMNFSGVSVDEGDIIREGSRRRANAQMGYDQDNFDEGANQGAEPMEPNNPIAKTTALVVHFSAPGQPEHTSTFDNSELDDGYVYVYAEDYATNIGQPVTVTVVGTPFGGTVQPRTGARTAARSQTKFNICPAHQGWFSGQTRRRMAENFVEGGPGFGPPCSGDGCSFSPGTDFYDASICNGTYTTMPGSQFEWGVNSGTAILASRHLADEAQSGISDAPENEVGVAGYNGGDPMWDPDEYKAYSGPEDAAAVEGTKYLGTAPEQREQWTTSSLSTSAAHNADTALFE